MEITGPADRRSSQFRIEFHGLLEVGLGQEDLPLPQAVSPFHVTQRGLRIHGDGTGEHGFGGLVFLQLAQRHSRSQKGQVMIGLPREGLPVAG